MQEIIKKLMILKGNKKVPYQENKTLVLLNRKIMKALKNFRICILMRKMEIRIKNFKKISMNPLSLWQMTMYTKRQFILMKKTI